MEKLPPGAPVETQPRQAVALTWLLVGLAFPFLFCITVPLGKIEVATGPLAIYLLSILALDLMVGFSSSTVTSQRITPAVVLALLLTPGIPPTLALVVDFFGVLSIAATSRLTAHALAQAGKSLLPASLTAFYLVTRTELNSETYFFACEVFVVISLLTRTDRAPYRSDTFLVISYPAVALLLRYLGGLHITYVLLAVPLLFLLTTMETGSLWRYFQLKKKLDDSRVEILETRKAQRQTEMESRQKGILLLRKEQQLSLLNGLGREMDGAAAAEDLGRFLLVEVGRLIGAERSILLLSDPASGQITKVLSQAPAAQWGLKEGERAPKGAESSISDKEPWFAPMWRGQRSFLTCQLGHEGWLFISKEEKDAFPAFLQDFFLAVGRHAGSAILALRRLTEVQAIARREAQEKRNVAAEREKVAEQNRYLQLLIDCFEGLAEGTLASDQELLRQAGEAVQRMTGADEVTFRARPFEQYNLDGAALAGQSAVGQSQVQKKSYIYCRGEGASGNLLCLSSRPNAFNEFQQEWCMLLQDFLDKTMENSNLHREVQTSYAQLQRTQQEIVVSSQWAAAGRLAANAAHELNTPLGAIRIAAEHISMYLEYEAGKPAPAVESMVSLMNSVEKCRKVTDRLLLTSRPVDQGALPLKPDFQSLAAILKEAMVSVSPYLRASKIKLVTPQPLPDFQVYLVMQDLYWAVVNIMKNGIDALNDANPPDKTMTISLEKVGSQVEVSIKDNGTGVPEEVKPRLFEAFFTTKKLGQGNGLGLSMSRTNLRRWGAEIEYKDTPEGGATFILKVPLA